MFVYVEFKLFTFPCGKSVWFFCSRFRLFVDAESHITRTPCLKPNHWDSVKKCHKLLKRRFVESLFGPISATRWQEIACIFPIAAFGRLIWLSNFSQNVKKFVEFWLASFFFLFLSRNFGVEIFAGDFNQFRENWRNFYGDPAWMRLDFLVLTRKIFEIPYFHVSIDPSHSRTQIIQQTSANGFSPEHITCCWQPPLSHNRVNFELCMIIT